MTAIRPTRLAALLAGLAVLSAPGLARADGDPASDVLLSSSVSSPYQEHVSTRLTKALDLATARARTAGLPIKVAIAVGLLAAHAGHPIVLVVAAVAGFTRPSRRSRTSGADAERSAGEPV